MHTTEDKNNNIIWSSYITYVHLLTGETIKLADIKARRYKIISKEQETEIYYKNNKQYGHIKKTFICTQTHRNGEQTTIQFE